MEICQLPPPPPPPSSDNNSLNKMSLLDSLFGTDGRNRKEEGIWTWIKNQKRKHQSKTKPKDKHQMLTRSITLSPGTIHSKTSIRPTSSLSTNSTLVPESSSSVSLSSYIGPKTSKESPTSSCVASSPHSSLSIPSSPIPPTLALTSPLSSIPIDYSRQRTLSERDLSVSSSSISSLSSETSRQQDNTRNVNGPIKRSTSSRSAPAHTYYISSKTNTNNHGNSKSSNLHLHQSHTKLQLRSMSHGELENQTRISKGRSTATMDGISEITSNDAHDGEGKGLDQNNRSSFRQQRWSSSDSPFTIHQDRESPRRSDLMKKSSRNDGWWWE